MSDRYIALIEAAYGSRPGDPNWNPEADLNGDGIVNYRDLGIAAAMEPDSQDGIGAAVVIVVGAIILYVLMR